MEEISRHEPPILLNLTRLIQLQELSLSRVQRSVNSGFEPSKSGLGLRKGPITVIASNDDGQKRDQGPLPLMTEPPADQQSTEVKEDTKANEKEEPKAMEDTQEVEPPKVNGHATTSSADRKQTRGEEDPDAQEMLITTLRTQIQDLFSQVTQLNGKLVKSYDRVSDLEDDLHSASSTIRTSTLKISELEMERTQHLAALNTGLLVEKTHVTTELNRLMERATEEAAQRGQAESARVAIEKELDDLSANLFDQANNMVAEARFARHTSEQKLREAEVALKGAEEAVSLMQQQMQALQAEREESEEKAQKALALMGKGKWVEQPEEERSITQAVRLLSSHAPYQEFMLFVAHLRSLHPTAPQPPAISTLLPLPFLARLVSEDSEPTVRLDLAPSLNWLSRRSVLAAIHTGQLMIEPMSSAALLHELLSSASTIPGLSSGGNQSVACALCGSDIFPPLPEADSSHPTPTSGGNSWTTGLFKRSTSSPASTRSRLPSINSDQYPPQVYVFRLAPAATAASSVPVPPPQRVQGLKDASSSFVSHLSSNTSQILSTPPSSQTTTIYPLCNGKWCLSRLRTTCTMWAFVRSGIVDKIWEEEVVVPPPPPKVVTSPSNEKPPPVPPRRKGIWGALTERAASWGGDLDKSKSDVAAQPAAVEKSATEQPPKTSGEDNKGLPPPPPSHPSISKTPADAENSTVRRVPPALPARSEVRRQPSPVQAPADEVTPEATDAPTAPPAEAAPQEPEAPPANPASQEPTAPPADAAPTSTPTPAPPAPASGTPALPARPPRRGLNPANVPLPPSRPQTPPVVASGSPSSPRFPPGAGTGAAPPPLPRRAANRGSRIIHMDGAGSRPGTPGPPAAGTPVAPSSPLSNRTAVDAAEVTDVKIDRPSPKSDEANKEAPAHTSTAAEESKAPAEVVPTPSSESEDVFVDAPSAVPSQSAAPAPPEDGAKEQPSAAEKQDPSANGDAATEVVPKPPATEEKAPEAVSEATAEPAAAKVLHEEPESVVDGPKSEKEKGDGENCVGDATWEERTWKEIVRLKEAMFWARVGGLRS